LLFIELVRVTSCIENLYIAGNFKAGKRIQIEDQVRRIWCSHHHIFWNFTWTL